MPSAPSATPDRGRAGESVPTASASSGWPASAPSQPPATSLVPDRPRTSRPSRSAPAGWHGTAPGTRQAGTPWPRPQQRAGCRFQAPAGRGGRGAVGHEGLLLLRVQPASVLVRVGHHSLRGIEPQHVTDGSHGRFIPTDRVSRHAREIARMTDADGNIRINRAPVLTLWAAVVAERLGFDRATALTLGQAVAGSAPTPRACRWALSSPHPSWCASKATGWPRASACMSTCWAVRCRWCARRTGCGR